MSSLGCSGFNGLCSYPISAKPIIDINVGVQSLEIARDMKEDFERLGYEHRPLKPEHPKDDMRFQELYVKGPEEKRTHHAHVTVYGGDYWNKDLLFRDYLRESKDIAEEYDNLKRELAEKYPGNREAYTSGKEEFIDSAVKKAKKERE